MEELEKDITLYDFIKEMKHKSVLIQIIEDLKEVVFNELGLCENLVICQKLFYRHIGVVIPYFNPRNRLVFKIYLRKEE